MISLDTHKLHRFPLLFFNLPLGLLYYSTFSLLMLSSFKRLYPNKYKLIKDRGCSGTCWVIELTSLQLRQPDHKNTFINCACFQVFGCYFCHCYLCYEAVKVPMIFTAWNCLAISIKSQPVSVHESFFFHLVEVKLKVKPTYYVSSFFWRGGRRCTSWKKII